MRQLLDSPMKSGLLSPSFGQASVEGFALGSEARANNSRPTKSLRKKLEAASLLNVVERPPNRKQVAELEQFLLEQIKGVSSPLCI